MSAHHTPSIAAADVTLPSGSLIRKLPILAGLVGVAGIATALLSHAEHGANLWAYLIACAFFLSIGLGATFFVVIFYLSRGGWHIAIRRLAEAVMATTPIMLLLLLPIVALGFDEVYTWAAEHALDHDEILQAKEPFLNKGFFLARYGVYLAIFTGITAFFFRNSRKQDATGDPMITRRAQALAAPSLALLALSSTFFAFDWLMSTDYHWFSTMYGVIFFAGGFMGNFAVLAILILMLRGKMGGAVTEHHLHGTGKMMWGITIFWAYTSFSQFMLIWYANIPEETLWYEHRWENGWATWSIVLFVGHFLVPMFGMMSRHVKKFPPTLLAMSVWLLFMHYIDLFWQVKPNIHHGHGAPTIGVAEIASFVGVGGVFVALVSFFLGGAPLVAVRDPRLPESLRYEDV
ncbi:MAG: quinol:cytochrome C oxidoreductase [Myxococcales bacterium]|nr:quinol:cytochrome C oxidoreductase [Myxococcales bacterium]MCB9519337.1 quinol:cytochrome C oxidoreductase [Myxococcales bacterium]MCB9530781.1 quinol:cytochrome C oxidoreductase [Myxococcales bacterium]